MVSREGLHSWTSNSILHLIKEETMNMTHIFASTGFLKSKVTFHSDIMLKESQSAFICFSNYDVSWGFHLSFPK